MSTDHSSSLHERVYAWSAALGTATLVVCVLGALAGPVQVPADDHHDHGPGAPVQYFTPPAQPPVETKPTIAAAVPAAVAVPVAVPVAVLPIVEPVAALPVTAKPALLPVTAVRSPVAPRAAVPPVAVAAPALERFVPSLAGEFPDPPYPRWARQQGIQGRLLVLVDVAASGAVQSVAVRESSGQASLDQHAADWVRLHWSWAPGAPRRYLVPFVFELQ